MPAERRLYPRFTLASRFNVLLKPPGSAPRSYRVVNFSRGGLLLLEAQAQPGQNEPAHSPELKAGQVAEVVFSDAPTDKQALEAAVVRLSDIHVAIRFVDPDSKVLDRLHAIVMKHVGAEEARRQVGALLDEVQEDLSLDETDEAGGASPRTPIRYLDESKAVTAPAWLGWTVIPALFLLAVALVYLYRIDERLTVIEATAMSRSEPGIKASSFTALQDEVRVLTAKLEQALAGLAKLQNSSVNEERFLILETQKEHLTQLASEIDGLKRDFQSLQDQAEAPRDPPAVPGTPEQAETSTPTSSWVVYIMSALNESALAGLETKLRGIGIAGERQTVTVRGETRHRLLVPGFESSADARAFAQQIQEQLKLRDTPWVAKRPQ